MVTTLPLSSPSHYLGLPRSQFSAQDLVMAQGRALAPQWQYPATLGLPMVPSTTTQCRRSRTTVTDEGGLHRRPRRAPSFSQPQQQLQHGSHHPPIPQTQLRRSSTNASEFRQRKPSNPSASMSSNMDLYSSLLLRQWPSLEDSAAAVAVAAANASQQYWFNQSVVAAAAAGLVMPPPQQQQHQGVSRSNAALTKSLLNVAIPEMSPQPPQQQQPISFDAFRKIRPSRSTRDLSQPLHVDCSVEYDLGNQPKIPKDSAPLLIIHPAYQLQKQQKQHQPPVHSPSSRKDRFHPYSSPSTSPHNMDVVMSSNHRTDGLRQDSSTAYLHGTRQSGITRHQSFAAPSGAHHRKWSHLSRGNKTVPIVIDLEKEEEEKEARKKATAAAKRRASTERYLSSTSLAHHLSMPDIHAQEPFTPTKAIVQSERQQQPRHSQAGQSFSSDAESGCCGDSGACSDLSQPLEEISVLGRMTSCDSGIGTPAPPPAPAYPTRPLPRGANIAPTIEVEGDKKWKSSVSGFVSGFLCCSAGVNATTPTLKPQTPQQQQPVQVRYHQTSVAPSSLWTTSPSNSSSDSRNTTHQESAHSSSSSSFSSFGRKNSDQMMTPWTMMSTAETPSSASLWSLPPSRGSVGAPRQKKPACPACRMTEGDCREGFCSSVWNKT